MTNHTVFEPIYPLSIFLFLWTSDTGAYCCGSLLHKRFPAKLFERISPNKSWVGSIGGGVLCLVVAYVLWQVAPNLLTLPQWMGLGITVCIFGTWGDLVESLFKRQLGIKIVATFCLDMVVCSIVSTLHSLPFLPQCSTSTPLQTFSKHSFKMLT